MKLENTTPTKRYNVTITFTPDEQDHLRAIMGRVSGSGPVHDTVDTLYEILRTNGAKPNYIGHINNLYVRDPNQ